jgi:DNA-directed RNA polymerase specialized sigma24 family protein
LTRHDADAARLVKLRYFAGLSHQEAADALGISRGAADRLWTLGRAWLFHTAVFSIAWNWSGTAGCQCRR